MVTVARQCPFCTIGALELEELSHQHVQCPVCEQWWCAVDVGAWFRLHPIDEEHARKMAPKLAREHVAERQMAKAHLN